MTANTSLFTFSALPGESGREELPSLGQNKRSRCDDVLGDKLQATQTTAVELDSPLPGPPIVDSYASRLLNPLSQYGKAAVEDFEMTDEDYQIKPGRWLRIAASRNGSKTNWNLNGVVRSSSSSWVNPIPPMLSLLCSIV